LHHPRGLVWRDVFAMLAHEEFVQFEIFPDEWFR